MADHTMFQQLIRALSWTFVHSLWQGLLLAILAGCVMVATRRSVPSLRYNLLSGLFFVFIATVAGSFIYEWNVAGMGDEFVPGRVIVGITGDIFRQTAFGSALENFSSFLDARSAWIVSVWLIFILVEGCRMMLGLSAIDRLRHRQVCSPIDEWSNKIGRLSERLGIRRVVTVLESGRVQVPVVLGYLKPVILLPVGMLANLPVNEVEAILFHELAHIRRHDYLVNLVQRIAEIGLFFNPGMRWVSYLMRIERENCCDEIAVSNTGDRIGFVQALIRFKESSIIKPAAHAWAAG